MLIIFPPFLQIAATYSEKNQRRLDDTRKTEALEPHEGQQQWCRKPSPAQTDESSLFFFLKAYFYLVFRAGQNDQHNL